MLCPPANLNHIGNIWASSTYFPHPIYFHILPIWLPTITHLPYSHQFPFSLLSTFKPNINNNHPIQFATKYNMVMEPSHVLISVEGIALRMFSICPHGNILQEVTASKLARNMRSKNNDRQKWNAKTIPQISLKIKINNHLSQTLKIITMTYSIYI